MTLSLAVNNPDGCPKDIVGPYIAAQCGGATLAGLFNYLTFSNGIAALEKSQGITRGSGAASAAVFDGAFGMIANPVCYFFPFLFLL